jgi:hypothetical protein
MVSPMPAHSIEPMPIDDLTVPVRRAPASVTPRCSGQSMALGQLVIGRHRHERVRRLHRDLELVEVVVLQDAGVVQRALDHGVGARLAVLFQQFALQRAGVDADPHRAAVVAGRLDDVAHAVGAADIARIDPQAGRAGLGGLDAALVVEVDVGHERHRLSRAMVLKAAVESVSGQETRTMSAPASSSWRICSSVAFGVAGQGVGHRLDGDGRVAADLDIADTDLARLAALDHAPGTNVGVIWAAAARRRSWRAGRCSRQRWRRSPPPR